MESKIIQVKVTNCSSDSWYNLMVGEILYVYEKPVPSNHTRTPSYRIPYGNKYEGNLIFCKNCEVVNNFPTLRTDYK